MITPAAAPLPASAKVYDTMKAAAAGMGHPLYVLKWAKNSGCPAFRGARIYADDLTAWLTANPPPENSGDAKDEKTREEIRKLRLANDAKEGRLVERAWVAERMQRAAGELNSFRAKSEAEHPMKFAAAAGDVAQCREIVRQVWDDIFAGMNALAHNFTEGPQ